MIEGDRQEGDDLELGVSYCLTEGELSKLHTICASRFVNHEDGWYRIDFCDFAGSDLANVGIDVATSRDKPFEYISLLFDTITGEIPEGQCVNYIDRVTRLRQFLAKDIISQQNFVPY